MANLMNQEVNNRSSYGSEELIEHVGTALLNGLGNLLDITAHEAKEDISGEEMPPVIITNERREKVLFSFLYHCHLIVERAKCLFDYMYRLIIALT